MAAPTKKVERFAPLRTLAEDPLGRWDLATDTQTGQPVVIRRLKGRLFRDAAALQAFVAHAKGIAADKRDGFQRILGVGAAGGEPTVVCAGSDFGTLAQIVGTAGVDPRKLADQFALVAGRLDALHAAGRIHGDIRPETLFFDSDGSLLLGERSSLHALFGWTEAPVRLPDGAVGTRVRADRLAPEAMRTGILDARSDQYAFALTLAECLGFRQGAWGPETSSAVQGVFRFALSANPADRYPTCAKMVDAVRGALGASRRIPATRIALFAAPVAALILAYVGGSLVGSARAATRADAARESAREEIAAKWQADLPKVNSLPAADGLAKNDAGSTAYDAFTSARESAQEVALRSQIGKLMGASRLKLDIDFAEKATVSEASSEPLGVLATEHGPPRLGQPDSPLTWKLKVQIPDVGKPVASYRVVLRSLDSRREPVGPDRELPLDTAKLEQSFEGTIAAPATGWASGTSIGLEAMLKADKSEEKWQNFGVATIGRFEWKTVEASVSPPEVRDRSTQGFAVPSGLEVSEGDLLLVTAKGKIRPASDERYKLMDLTPIDNGPEGLEIKSPNIRRYSIVSDKLNKHWAALLVRFGERSEWELTPSKPIQIEPAQAGPVYLSINSVTQQDQKPLKANDTNWWMDNGQFDVTIRHGSLAAPMGSTSLQGVRGRMLGRIARAIGVESDAPAESAEMTLAGAWESDEGTKISVTDVPGGVRLQLTSSDTFKKLDFAFQRDGDVYYDRGSTMALASDPRGRTFETDSHLLVTGPDSFALSAESLAFDGEELVERRRDGLQMQFGRVNARKVIAQPGSSKPTEPGKSDPEKKKGLFAYDFSGTWIARDYGCRFDVQDDGKTLQIQLLSSQIEFESMVGVVEKSEKEFKVVRWDVVYLNDNYTPKRPWKLKGKMAFLNENTLGIQTDKLRFNTSTGQYLGQLNYGYSTYWVRAPKTGATGTIGLPTPYVPGIVPAGQPSSLAPAVQPRGSN